MNHNLVKAFKKAKEGYAGNYKGFHIVAYKTFHKGWCCKISKDGVVIFMNGCLTKTLPYLVDAKNWARSVLPPPETKAKN